MIIVSINDEESYVVDAPTNAKALSVLKEEVEIESNAVIVYLPYNLENLTKVLQFRNKVCQIVCY